MQLKYLLFFSVISVVAFGGCDQPKRTTESWEFKMPDPEPYKVPGGSRSTRELVEASHVECAEANCPDAIGQLVIRESTMFGSYAGTCTGWLVDHDIVATNSHCVPKEVKENPANCPSYMGIKFPAEHGYREEIHMCSQMIQFSDIAKGGMTRADFAFFRIDSSSPRTPLRMARSPMPEKMQLDVFAVDPIVGTIDGRIRHKTCVTHQGSVVLAQYNNDYADTVTGFGDECRVVQGNSGSPAFNSNGQVVAVVYATGKDTIQDTINEQAHRHGISGNLSNFHVALFTSFACLDLPRAVSITSAPRECGSVERGRLETAGELMLESLASGRNKADSDSAVQALTTDGPRPFKYDFKEKRGAGPPATLSYDVRLICLRPRGEWPAGSFDLNGNSLRIRYSVPVYTYGKFLDQFARIEAHRTGESKTDYTLEVDLSRMNDGKLTSMESLTSSPVSTRWCTPGETASL